MTHHHKLMATTLHYPLPLLSDWPRVAKKLLGNSKGAKVWLLSGPLGAGKTTLVKAVGEVLGVKEAIQSPSFGLLHLYTTQAGGQLCHVDLYRLEEAAAIEALDLATYTGSADWSFIEWGEKATPHLQGPYWHVHITPQGKGRLLTAGYMQPTPL